MDNKRIAVLQIIRGGEEEIEPRLPTSINPNTKIKFHISVPYVSIYNNFDSPYKLQKVSNDTLKAYSVSKDIDFKNLNKGKLRAEEKIDHNSFDTIYFARAARKGYEMQNIKRDGSLKNTESSHVYESAKNMTEMFFLESISDYLFSLEGKIDLIKIFTNDISMPWDWIYNEKNGKPRILSEVFGVGVTKAKDTVSDKKNHESLTKQQLRDGNHSALIISNEYSDEPENYLKDLKTKLEPIIKKTQNVFGEESTYHLHFGDKSNNSSQNHTIRNLRDILNKERDKLKFIYLIGHFTGKRGLLISADGDIDYSFLNNFSKTNKGDFFSNHPIVILNGCSTRLAGASVIPTNDPNVQIPLAQGLLDMGACASIVTSVDVKMNYVIPFSNYFVNFLFKPGSTVGEALKKTRLELAKNDCHEWASYHLHGDPSFIMIKKNV